MGLDILPKGGAGFKVSSGYGSFARKLSNLTRNQGGEFGNLKDNRSSIVGAFKKYASVIKSTGGLNRSQQGAVMGSIKRADKNLSDGDKKALKEIVGHYSRGHSSLSDKSAERQSNHKVIVHINRDSDSSLDFNDSENEIRPGVAARVNQAVSISQIKKSGNSSMGSRNNTPSSVVSVSQLHQTNKMSSPTNGVSASKPMGNPNLRLKF